MKSSRYACLSFCAIFALASLSLAPAENPSLTVELKAAYQSGFYPGVVQYADRLLAENPSSAFAPTALLYKGESLYRMGQLSDAARALLAISKDDPAVYAGRCYWLGRIYQDAGRHEDALRLFYEATKDYKKEGKGSENAEREDEASVYAYALFYAGISQYEIERYKEASALFDYVLANGSSYATNDYEKACLLQLLSLNKAGEYDRAKKTADALLEKAGGGAGAAGANQAGGNSREAAPFAFGPATLYTIILYRADASNGLKQYRAAYDDYCTVIAQADSALAAIAMSRSYTVSSEHRAAVGEEPGAVLEKAKDRLSTYPELVSQFWTRLAIDAFNAGDYKKSLSYFDEAASGATKDLLQTAALYRTEIAFKNTLSSGTEKAARTALESLDFHAKETGLSATDALAPAFAVSRARYAALTSDWKLTRSSADEALSSSDEKILSAARYWKALSQYQAMDYKDAVATLGKPDASDAASRNLLARALAKSGKIRAADAEFYSLGEKSLLDENGTLDYAKSLMNGGFMVSAANQAAKTTGAESDYISALSLFNRKKWTEAASSFEKALKGSGKSALSNEYRAYALFYAGYCHYRLGNFDAAWNHLYRFVTDYQTHPLRFMGLTTAVRSSVQEGKFDRAFPLANDAVTTALTNKQKEEALFLSAGVYADAGLYLEATKVLQPYINEKTEFGFQCLYKSAQLHGLNKNYTWADNYYERLTREKKAASLAEDAAYRRGELYYSIDDYEKAVVRFRDYLQAWPKGQYEDAALFFGAISRAKLGGTARAILDLQQLDDLPRESTYRYSAEKNLIDLLRSQKDYGQALAYAQKMMKNYGDQSKNDGIPDLIRELEALNSGSDERTIRKLREYEKAGKEKTAEGRKAGTELVALYAKSSQTASKARSLAEELLSEQKKHDAEAAYAAKNAAYLAGVYRAEGAAQKAADTYLAAAQYARTAGDDETAGRSLYGAVEAFDAAGKLGDAKATYESLETLYPKSRFVEAAAQIVKQGN